MSADSGKLVAAVVGDAPGLGEVLHALEHHDEVELLRETDGLAALDVDAVLLATPEPELPRGQLASVTDQTRAPVILLAPATAPHLLEEALGAEFVDAVLMPQPAETVLFALRKAAGPRPDTLAPAPARGVLVAVFSPKGGTGKSVTATNLAVALASCERRRTLLVDLDLQFGDSAIMLALEPQKTIHDLVTAPGELDAEKLAGYTVPHESGLEVIAAPDHPEEAELITQPKVAGLLEVARGAYDVVVVDTSPFLHGPVLAALDHVDLLLLVATLDVPALKDVRQSLETLDLLRFPEERIAMVLNRATAKVGITRADAEAALGTRMRYTLPHADEVPLAVNRGRPAVLVEPRSEFAQAVRVLASDVAARKPAPVPRDALAETR